jgi:hypothetical protein
VPPLFVDNVATGEGSENYDLDEADEDPVVPSQNGTVAKGTFL